MPETNPPENYVQVDSAVQGIDVYAPRPEGAAPQPEVVTFTCPRCGATTAYNAGASALKCSHCGYTEEAGSAAVGRGAQQYEFTVETLEQAAQGWGLERKDVECQNCGAVTSTPPDSLTHTCPFCGSNKVIQRAPTSDALRPRYLIPFKVEPAACRAIAGQWLGSSWMTPAALSRAANLATFTGIYLPFWTFDADLSADWKAEVGHIETERYYENGEWKSRTRTVWRWENGRAHVVIDDLVVEGTTKVSNLLLSKIKDHDLSDLCEYDPKYLAGLQAQAYDVPLEQAWEKGRVEMRERAKQACLGQTSTGQVRNFSMDMDFAEESWRYMLLPVYLAPYLYEGKTYQVLINGQNGSIAGQRPVDWNRVWLAVAALVAPGILLSLLGLLTVVFGGIGVAVGGVGFVLLIIGLVIAIIILVQANKMDDI